LSKRTKAHRPETNKGRKFEPVCLKGINNLLFK